MIKVALLGAAHGHVGYAITEAAATDDVTIVAAAEPDPAMRAAHLADAPVEAGDDVLRTLDETEVDVAVVCGVYAERAAVVEECLRRGIAVLADKPLCTTLEQWERIAAAATGEARLAVMFDKRFYAETAAARQLLADGVLGDLAMVASSAPHKLLRDRRPDWFFRRDGYGGIAADLPVHDIDIVLALTGATAGSVSALAGSTGLVDGFDDHVAVLLRAGEVTATIDASWLQPAASAHHGDYRMRLVGSAGTAEIDWARHTVTVTTADEDTRQVPLPDQPRPVQFFFDALREGRAPDVSTRDSLAATRIALLAQRSADQGGARLDWDSGRGR